MSKYKINVIDRVKWYFSDKSTPKPVWVYPADNWITDPEEIIKAIRLDDDMGVR